MFRAWAIPAVLAAAVLAAGGTALAQGADAARTTPPPNYIKTTADELSRVPAEYSGKYVQLADVFGVMVDRYPGRLGVSPQTHFAFRTHRAVGSNMLCVVPRDNKEAQAFFDTPLTAETPIYLMGRVGPMVDAGDAVVPVLYVDRVVRGSTPPPVIREEQKKEYTLTFERVVGGNYVKVKDYKIPEAGKRYVVDDPYDPSKKIYVTIQVAPAKDQTGKDR